MQTPYRVVILLSMIVVQELSPKTSGLPRNRQWKQRLRQMRQGQTTARLPRPPSPAAKRRDGRQNSRGPAAKESPSPSQPWSLDGQLEINHFGQGGSRSCRYRIPRDNSLQGRQFPAATRQATATGGVHSPPAFFLDLQLSYGLHPRLDLIADLRFALQQDPANSTSFSVVLAPGIRYWLTRAWR